MGFCPLLPPANINVNMMITFYAGINFSYVNYIAFGKYARVLHEENKRKASCSLRARQLLWLGMGRVKN